MKRSWSSKVLWMLVISLAPLASPVGAQFAYVANSGDNTVSGYTINGVTGALTPISGSPFGAGKYPISVAVDPTGKFAYVANIESNNVSGYTINGVTGALTPITGSPFAAGSRPQSVAVDPTGKFAYVANFDGSRYFSGYTINGATGALTPISGSPFAAGFEPHSVSVDPTGKFAYVANFGSYNVSEYRINSVTGALTPISGSPLAAGMNPTSVAVDPTGKFAYVANENSGNVSGYTINGVTGALAPISGSPFGARLYPESVAVDPTGKFAYVANQGSGDVSGYTINGVTGALTVISGSPFTAGLHPISIAVDPTGKFAYVVGDNNVSGYTINGVTGALTVISGPPFLAGSAPKSVTITGPTPAPPPTITKTFGAAMVPLNGSTTLSFTIANPAANTVALAGIGFADTLPSGLVVATPNGQVGTCDGGTITATAGSGTVSLLGAMLAPGISCIFSINVTGTTGGVKNNSVTVASANRGTGNTAMATIHVIAPPVLMKSFGSDSIDINGTTTLTFTLTNDSAVVMTGAGFTDTLPAGLIIFPDGLTGSCGAGSITATTGTNLISLTGAMLPPATSCSFSVNVTGISAGMQTNTTSALTSNEFGNGPAATAGIIVLRPMRAQFAYVAGGGSISGYTINGVTGALTPVSGSPFDAGGSSRSIAVDPTGKFAYVANIDGNISGYTINGVTGVLTPITGSPFVAGSEPYSVTVDPTGKFVYVANNSSGNVSGYTINGVTGALTSIIGSPFPAGSGPRSVAVDPTGKFAYVGNFSAFNVSGYTINGVTGVLTPITGSPFAAGLYPESVAVDSTGKFAYVANLTSSVTNGNVSGYTINAKTGALTPITGSPFPAGLQPNSVTVDPTGKFAYVANDVSDNVSGYTINGVTGALTPISGSPFAAGVEPWSVAVDATGKFAYVANASSDNVSGYAINGVTGAITPVTGSPFAAAPEPFSVAVASRPVIPVTPPTIIKAFAKAVIPVNGGSTLTFTIINPNAVPLTGVGFTDSLPAGIGIGNFAGFSIPDCGAGAMFGANGNTISLSAATIPAGGTCTAQIAVIGNIPGVYVNTTSVVTSNEAGPSGTASATLTVVGPPTISKAFGAASINVNGTTTLSFTLKNPNATMALTGVGFSDTLPAGLIISTPNGLAGSCGGGTLTATAGTNLISLASAMLGAGGSCTFSVNVTAISAGLQTNTTSAVISNEGGTGLAATAGINVLPIIDAEAAFQIRYLANLNQGDSYVNFTNAGTLNGFDPGGRICINVYTFDPAEELISCCACPVTPNGLNSLSARNDLISNTLTPGVPTSITVKLLSSVPVAGVCNASSPTAANLVRGMRAWATTLHLNTSGSPTVGYQHTETPFSNAELSVSELQKLTGFCAFIQANGSGFGICKSCRAGGLGADSK